VVVNGRFLEPGQKRKLRQIKGEIDLTGIRLNYEISSFTLP